MIEETWDARELPILRAIYGARDEGSDLNRAGHDAVPDLDDRRFLLTLSDLSNGGYLKVIPLRGDSTLLGAVVEDLTPAGLRVVGAWPSGMLTEHFFKAIERRMESEADPEKKKFLELFFETATNVGTGVLTGVLTHVMTRGL